MSLRALTPFVRFIFLLPPWTISGRRTNWTNWAWLDGASEKPLGENFQSWLALYQI